MTAAAPLRIEAPQQAPERRPKPKRQSAVSRNKLVKALLTIRWELRPAPIEDLQRNGFNAQKLLWHEFLLCDRLLNPAQRLVGSYLMQRTNDRDRVAWPSIRLIHDDTGIPERS